jgi:hypothetical protein
MAKTPKKTQGRVFTSEEWERFERALDAILKSLPQPKKAKKKAKKK